MRWSASPPSPPGPSSCPGGGGAGVGVRATSGAEWLRCLERRLAVPVPAPPPAAVPDMEVGRPGSEALQPLETYGGADGPEAPLGGRPTCHVCTVSAGCVRLVCGEFDGM